MALTANRDVDRYVDQDVRSFAVAASTHIYKGSLVGLSSGYARPLEAGDTCVGIAYEEADNTAGSAGDVSIRVCTQGDFQHTLAGAAVTNIGDAVYASADDTLTFTSTDNSFVGVCAGLPKANTIVLRLNPWHAAAS